MNNGITRLISIVVKKQKSSGPRNSSYRYYRNHRTPNYLIISIPVIPNLLFSRLLRLEEMITFKDQNMNTMYVKTNVNVSEQFEQPWYRYRKSCVALVFRK